MRACNGRADAHRDRGVKVVAKIAHRLGVPAAALVDGV
jgi:hypothetical protein